MAAGERGDNGPTTMTDPGVRDQHVPQKTFLGSHARVPGRYLSHAVAGIRMVTAHGFRHRNARWHFYQFTSNRVAMRSEVDEPQGVEAPLVTG